MSETNGHPTAHDGTDDGGELSPRQEAAAVALASGKTIAQAARAANSGARTVKTWLSSVPCFSRRIHGLRSEMTQRALGVLVAAMTDASCMLAKLARTAKAEQIRLLASRSVIELGSRMRENVEFEERLAALESRATTPGTIFVSGR